jgi:thiamine biosynthesis lipoprotein
VEIARHWDDVLTTWRPEGELARLNAAAGKGPQRITSDLASALMTMVQLSDATDGAFDPGVGPLVATYSSTSTAAPASTAPTRIRAALRIDGVAAELLKGAALDAGGIGKGIALDAIAAELRAAGAAGAYLDFGGSSQLAFGASESGAPWTLALAGLDVGVRHGSVQLDGALSTSRSRPMGDQTGPIVDPRTSRIVESRRFVTCYAASATQAEACSKAFIVLGWSAFEARQDRDWEALYEDTDGVQVSPRFASMISVAPNAREDK